MDMSLKGIVLVESDLVEFEIDDIINGRRTAKKKLKS
jgi:hypothetical protein